MPAVRRETAFDALFKPLPVTQAGELFSLFERPEKGTADVSGGTGEFLVFSYPRFRALEGGLARHGRLAATTRSTRVLVRPPSTSDLTAARMQLVSGSYFSVLGSRLIAGRALTPDDERQDGQARVAVVSYGFAARTFGSIDDAIARELIVNDLPLTVVGVAAPDFVGAWTDSPAEMWVPLTLQHAIRYQSNVSSYAASDRTKPWILQSQLHERLSPVVET